MIFTACADLHLTESTPTNRKDDYLKTQLRKFEFILKMTRKKSTDNLLCIAGDLFDKPKASYEFLSILISLIKKYKTKIYYIPGQHDLRYHNPDIHNIPIKVLESARCLHRLTGVPKKINSVSFLGSGWNDSNQILYTEKGTTVYVTHTMVINNKLLFPGQSDYTTAKQIIKDYENDFIITGDNHKEHIVKYNGRFNINCGCMLRNKKDMVNHQPYLWVINTDKKKVKRLKIPIQPPEEVFDFGKIELEEQRKKNKIEMDALILSIKDNSQKPNFIKIMEKVLKNNKPNKNVVQIINNFIEEELNA